MGRRGECAHRAADGPNDDSAVRRRAAAPGCPAAHPTLVALLLWLGGYVPSLLAYDMIRLYPRSILYQWGLVGLLEMILAALAGARLYRERDA